MTGGTPGPVVPEHGGPVVCEPGGPLVRAMHASTGRFPRLTPLRKAPHLEHIDSMLFGRRGLYRPNVALHTIQRLGPVRHAIAQRTVAGMVEVHAPWAPKLETPASDSKGAPRRPAGSTTPRR